MKGWILQFPKKRDLKIIRKYSGKTLTAIAAKVYTARFLNLIQPEIEKILKKNLNGFRMNCSSTSQILTIR